MAANRRFMLLLGFVGSMFLMMLSVYQWDMSQKAETIQDQRKQLLREACHRHKEEFTKRKPSFDNLIVDDKHGIIYCYIPKVACTNWKRFMYVLKQGEPYPDLMSISHVLVHGNLPLLKRFPELEMKARLKHYTKFLYVRDPFVRLISAYEDKFHRLNEHYYKNYGRDILRLYGNQPHPPQTMAQASASGVHVSFYNFIQYLVDPRTEKYQPFQEHWRQMHHLCHPCLIEYDFVGHQETLQDDAEQLLKILKLEDIKFPIPYKNMTSHASVWDWFSTVPLEDRRKFYKLYEEDFRLFGYRRPDELLDG